MANESERATIQQSAELINVFEDLESFSDDDWSSLSSGSDQSSGDEVNVDDRDLVQSKPTKSARRNLKFLDQYIETVLDNGDSAEQFTCNVCCKRFKTKQGCKTHLLNGHNITGKLRCDNVVFVVDKIGPNIETTWSWPQRFTRWAKASVNSNGSIPTSRDIAFF